MNETASKHIDILRRQCESLLQLVIPIGLILFRERDFKRLVERVLLEVRSLCHADGGTLYLLDADESLRFVIVRNQTLGIDMGGTSDITPAFPPLQLHDPATGLANHRNIATHVALTGEPICIDDAYEADGFDFSGTRDFDRKTNYRTKSVLTLPLKNGAGQVIGVLQLINSMDTGGNVVPFDLDLMPVINALTDLAAAAVEQLVRENGLKEKIQQLQVNIDQAKRARQVTEITGSQYFQSLAAKAKLLREQFAAPQSSVEEAECPV